MTRSRKTQDADNPPLTQAQLRGAAHARDVPEKAARLAAKARGRPPKSEPLKVAVSIRLDAEVVEHFKGEGPGWQTRVNDMLAAHVRRARRKRA